MSNRPVEARIFPTNTRSSYKAFNIVDFNVSVPGRKIVCNSFKLQGKLQVFKNGTVRTISTDNIFIDPMVGASAMFQDFTTSTDNQGVLEVFQNQPRYEKMMLSAIQTNNDNFNSHNAQMLRTSTLPAVRSLINGEKRVGTPTANPNVNELSSFSVKPVFILNQTSSKTQGGDVNLQSSKVGNIMISVRLARDSDVLWGTDVVAQSSYQITDLSLTFKHVPDDGVQNPIVMRTKTAIRQTIQSSFSNFAANANGLINGCSMSFLKSSDEGSLNANTLALNEPENVSNVQFLMNDSQNQLLTYNLETQQNILMNYLDSISQSDENAAQLWKLKENESYGIGLPFREFIDLSSNRLSVNIQSGIATQGAAPSYELFCFLNGTQEIE
jgi:hypothetical protein